MGDTSLEQGHPCSVELGHRGTDATQTTAWAETCLNTVTSQGRITETFFLQVQSMTYKTMFAPPLDISQFWSFIYLFSEEVFLLYRKTKQKKTTALLFSEVIIQVIILRTTFLLLFSSIGFCHRLFRERVEQGKQDKIRCFIDTHIIYSGCACNCSCFIFILNLVNQIHTEFNYLNFQGVMLKSRVWPHMLKNTEIHMCRRKEKLNSNFHNKKINPVQA